MRASSERPRITSPGAVEMSAEAAALTRSFRVGKRTCTLTVPAPRIGSAVTMVVEWTPTVPRRLTKAELRAYRAGRDAALADLALLTGLQTCVVEI